MLTQKVQITAFQSVSTAAVPPPLPSVDASDIEQAMAASTAGAAPRLVFTERHSASLRLSTDATPSTISPQNSLPDT